ncbi:MAG TPA: imidazolonepropionase [bacterium]|nr:imidazolonepropionase [bacterium]
MPLTLVRNASIWTPRDAAAGRPAAGPGQAQVCCWDAGAMLCRDGRIAAVGPEQDILKTLHAGEVDSELDCGGRCVVPGFVDPHTHMCFRSARESEFSARLSGADYREILRAGGGILASVRDVRSASEEELFQATRARAMSALRHGTTTLEVKSGYGLAVEHELKQLGVISRVGRETPLHVVPTFLGAHAVPEELHGRTDRYVDAVAAEMIPAVARQGCALFCDVFCEAGVFSVPQSRKILEAARAAGLGVRLHADELSGSGGAELAASLGAVCADHLLAASDAGLRAMAEAGTVAVLLPATAYSLKKPYAAARKMIGMNLPVAIATDCNPGSSFTESVPFIFGLAVLQMGLTVAEALCACTLNAACAVGMGKETGSLVPGKRADFLVLDGESPAILAFHAGVPPVADVYIDGRPAWSRKDSE